MLLFKSNINCSGCVAKVTPFLDETAGAGNWQVDTNQPDKPLTITSDVLPEAVIAAVKKAGFSIAYPGS